jgi:hypothetical protein
MARTKTVSAGNGPAIPAAFAAGASTSTSSLPNLPESPACGFSAHNAILGSAMPNKSRNPSRVMRAASVIVSMLSKCVTWLNGM